MSLHGRRVVILAEKQYEDLELWYPKLRLQEEGAEVVVAGLGEPAYESKHGYPVKVDSPLEELRPQDFDGIVVPGGWAPDYLRRHESVKSFVREMDTAGKLVAAICHGGSVLVSAGILRGRRLTSVGAIKDDLVNAGAAWEDAEVVVDANLVSSRRPDDLPAFLREMIGMLRGGRRSDPSARAEIEGPVLTLHLETASFDYMLDMLCRMPNAREYHGEGLQETRKDLREIVQDFARESDPKGTLEAEPPIVLDVVSKDGVYRARGNDRLYETLSHGEVPGVKVV